MIRAVWRDNRARVAKWRRNNDIGDAQK